MAYKIPIQFLDAINSVKKDYKMCPQISIPGAGFLILIFVMLGGISATAFLTSKLFPKWTKQLLENQENTRMAVAILGVLWGGVGWLVAGYFCF